MTQYQMKHWLPDNKKGLIIGFILGAFVAPFLAILGLQSLFFEWLRPLLVGPMDMIGRLIPNIQTEQNAYYVPSYKWIITLGFNGICYAILGGIIQNIIRSMKAKKMS